jgi:hypothetical protein
MNSPEIKKAYPLAVMVMDKHKKHTTVPVVFAVQQGKWTFIGGADDTERHLKPA